MRPDDNQEDEQAAGRTGQQSSKGQELREKTKEAEKRSVTKTTAQKETLGAGETRKRGEAFEIKIIFTSNIPTLPGSLMVVCGVGHSR